MIDKFKVEVSKTEEYLLTDIKEMLEAFNKFMLDNYHKDYTELSDKELLKALKSFAHTNYYDFEKLLVDTNTDICFWKYD